MTRLRSLIKEVLSQPKKKDCGCGCNDCGGKAPILTESKVKHLISEGLQYHMDKKISLFESVYRMGSEKHFELIREARALWVRGIIDVSEDDQAILETHLGNFGMYEGEEVPLDMPMVNEEKKVYGLDKRTWDVDWRLPKDNLFNASKTIKATNNRMDAIRKMLERFPKELDKFENDPDYPALNMNYDELVKWYKSVSNFSLSEAAKKKKKKDPPLNKPKRGGSKAYYVYVRNPKTKKIKKVSFGSGGLRAKIRNPKARKAFAARHNCKNKKDRTKAGYWSCNLPRYAEQLGLGSKMNTFW